MVPILTPKMEYCFMVFWFPFWALGRPGALVSEPPLGFSQTLLLMICWSFCIRDDRLEATPLWVGDVLVLPQLQGRRPMPICTFPKHRRKSQMQMGPIYRLPAIASPTDFFAALTTSPELSRLCCPTEKKKGRNKMCSTAGEHAILWTAEKKTKKHHKKARRRPRK